MSHNFVNQEGKNIIAGFEFKIRKDGKLVGIKDEEIFKGKKVVVFGLPGAFTPTCSSSHLPRYEELYNTFKENGIDEVYCLSVNDAFVMDAWAEDQGLKNVKVLPDGNAELTKHIQMDVMKDDLGFGLRSWRYSMLVDDGVIVKHFIEPDKEGDPFEVSDADTMIKFLKNDVVLPASVTIFTKKGCPFCKEAKELLTKTGYMYNEVELSDARRQRVLSGITGKKRPTSPQIFMDGKLIGGLDNLKEHLGVKQ